MRTRRLRTFLMVTGLVLESATSAGASQRVSTDARAPAARSGQAGAIVVGTSDALGELLGPPAPMASLSRISLAGMGL
jgi:hypothetical protein